MKKRFCKEIFMIILQGNDLSRHFGADSLFQHVNITIQHNSRIALVGRNGVGKSTLLKILAGIENSDTGHVSQTKHLRIGYLDQQTSVDSTRTIWEEMMSLFTQTIALQKQVEQLALDLTDDQLLNDDIRYQQTLQQYATLQHELEERGGYRYEADIRSILHGFGFSKIGYDRAISELSGGQKTRLALAKMLLTPYDLLILDEPTNHLDIHTLTWLETYLTHYKGALLIVSHDRYFLDKVANEVYELSRQQSHHYKGNYSHFLIEKEQRLQSALKAYAKQQKEIEKLEDFVSKNLVRASTTKRAQSRRKQLEKMTRIEKPILHDKQATFRFITQQETGQIVVQTNSLAIGYQQTVLSEPIQLDIRKQQAIAIVGENGVGKSTLFKTLLNQTPALNGTISFGSNVSIGYYDQEQQQLTPHKDVLHELWDDFSNTNEKDIRSILGSFLFTQDDVTKPVHALSGGERARILLAKLAMKQDNVLFLDEPTNHLDLDSKEVLEDALIAYDGTILFVSHDRYFINRIATAVIELTPQGSTLYLGDYDYYLEKKQVDLPQQVVIAEQTDTSQQTHYTLSKETSKQKRSLERQIESLESQMVTIETQISMIQEKLTQPTVFSDHEKSLELSQELEQHQNTYDTLFSDWEETTLALEKLTQL